MTISVRVDPSVLQYRTEVRPEVQPDGSIVYMAEIPDLSGCMSHGATIDEARQNLEDAKREYLAALQERNLSIPVPPPDQPVGAVTWTISVGGFGQRQSGSVHVKWRTEALEPA